MKKRILVLSFLAASMFGAFAMPLSDTGYEAVVSAEEVEDDAEAAEDNEDTVPEEDELTEEQIAEYSAGVTDEQIISYSEQNLNVLVTMDLTNYDPETSADAAMVNDWYAIKDQVGAYVSQDSATVERDGRKLKGIIDATCENAKVRFTVTFDVLNGLESIQAVNLDAQEEETQSFGALMATAGVNTLLGMGTVFVMLFFMSELIGLMKYIPQLFEPKRKPVETVPVPVPAPVAAPAAVEEDLSNDEELVAVISAAIAAYEGENNVDGFVVRSIRRH